MIQELVVVVKLIFDSLKSIHFHTELLEALGWDEEETDSVIKQLDEYFCEAETKPLDQVKFDLRVKFRPEVCESVIKYIDYVAKRVKESKGTIEIEA
mgnify:CR=1 FL=1